MAAEFNPIVRSIKRPTYPKSIKAICAHCVGCTETHLERGFKESIRACGAFGCPLYRYRPYQHSEHLRSAEANENV